MRIIVILLFGFVLQSCAQVPRQAQSNESPSPVQNQAKYKTVNDKTKLKNQHLNQQIHHVVLVWLTDEYKDQLPTVLKASRKLANIPGVVHLKASTAIKSERAIVDDSFDLGIWMTFKSVADMNGYLKHTQHQKFLKKYIHGKVHRVKAYDF